jgi:hypothetical protein
MPVPRFQNAANRIRRLPVLWLGLCAFHAALGGCSLFSAGAGFFGDGSEHVSGKAPAGNSANLLPPIPIPPDAIQIEVIRVERPVGDPLLGPRLWDEMAPASSLSAEERDLLRRHGFRVGTVCAAPPRALQSLLELGADGKQSFIDHEQKRFSARFAILAGTRGEIFSSAVYPECTLKVPTLDGEKTESFKQARFILSVTAKRLQEGWARLDVLPEIHHGEMTLRRDATPGGFQARTGQEIVPLYGQRFSVALAKGEMAVLTADAPESDNLGRRFFVGSDQEGRVQRLLLVRLLDMEKAKLYAE